MKAKVKLKTDNGAVYSDFDIQMDASARKPVVHESTSGHGKFKVQFDRAMYGLINGGGPDMSLTTFNANIYIRKAKENRWPPLNADKRGLRNKCSICVNRRPNILLSSSLHGQRHAGLSARRHA